MGIEQITIQELNERVNILQEEVAELKDQLSEQNPSEEDIEFNNKTKAAWGQIDNGDSVTQSKEEFLQSMKLS
jgi:prefoldin subunit 5